MIKFLVLDEVDRIIELNQFKELDQILHHINRLYLTKEEEDQNFQEHKELRNFVEFEGKTIDVIDEGELKKLASSLTKEEIREARII